jgi:hypothetical protein
MLALCAYLTGVTSPAWAQAKIAVPILLKVLTYDETFDSRGKGPFVVLVVGESHLAAGREALFQELNALSVTSIRSRPLRFIGFEMKDEKSLAAEVEKSAVDALLALPGISAAGVRAISAVAEQKKRYSLALDAAMVEQAISVGVTTTGGKPQIVINESASRAVGARFEASVLKLARVVK